MATSPRVNGAAVSKGRGKQTANISPDERAEMVRLHVEEGRTFMEIAKRLDRNSKTVSTHVMRGLREVAEARHGRLEEYYDDLVTRVVSIGDRARTHSLRALAADDLAAFDKAINTELKVQLDVIKLLGLQPADKIEVRDTTGETSALEKLRRAVSSQEPDDADPDG